MKRLLWAVFMVVAVIPAHAKWVEVGADSGKGEAHYFDPDTTQNNGYLRKVWVLSNYAKQQIGGHHSIKTFYEIDCNEEKIRSLTMLLYSETNAVGNVVGAYHKEELGSWTHYLPGSIFNQLSDVLCALD